MASVIKRGGTWYARWKYGAGRRRSEKSVCVTRKDAQRFADDLERKAESQRHGLEPLHKEAPPMTFGELFEWWLRE